MSLASRMAALALPALLAGCEMGAPVVGLREGPARGNDSCAVPSDQTCYGVSPTTEPIFDAAPNHDVMNCFGRPAPDPTQRVELSVELGELVLPLDPNCARYILDLRGTGVEDIALPALRLEAGEIAIYADTPVLLHGSLSLSNTQLNLDGPVSLRIESGAAWYYTKLTARDASASAVFTDSTIRNLVVRAAEEDRPFPGRLSIAVSQVTELFAWVDALTLDRVKLKESKLNAAHFHLLDAEADAVQIEAGDGDILSATMTKASLIGCDRLLLAGVKCASCLLRGCRQEPLRIDSSVIERSNLVGDLSLQGTACYTCKFGDGADSRLLAHGGLITTPLFCDDMASIRLVGATTTCADCQAVDISDPAQYCQYSPAGGRPTSGGEPLPVFGEGLSTPDDQPNPACPAIGALPACATPPIPNRPY